MVANLIGISDIDEEILLFVEDICYYMKQEMMKSWWFRLLTKNCVHIGKQMLQ